MLQCNLLYLKTMPSKFAFVVPGLKHQAAIDGCHHYISHQCRDHMLKLLKERFWWPGMAQQMMMSILNCAKCRIFEARPQMLDLELIIYKSLDLVHIDYMKMEVTVDLKEKPVVKDVLVVKDHFTHYVQAYITKNHMA